MIFLTPEQRVALREIVKDKSVCAIIRELAIIVSEMDLRSEKHEKASRYLYNHVTRRLEDL